MQGPTALCSSINPFHLAVWCAQAKLQADFDQLADGLRDLSDLLPELESNVERMVDGLAGMVSHHKHFSQLCSLPLSAFLRTTRAITGNATR